MKFKNITCLIKVADNQTQTEHFEDSITFNTSKLYIEGKVLNLDVKDREVVFVASSIIERSTVDSYKRPIINVELNWVECFKDIETSYNIPNDITDILVITRSIYDELVLNGNSNEDIYKLFRQKGLGKMSVELPKITDFSALTAQVVE